MATTEAASVGGPRGAGLMPADSVALGAVALVAAAAQTISGFGMNLLLAPVAQVIVPGTAAVRLVAGLGAVLNSTVLAASWRAVLWVPAALLLGPTLAATFLIGPLLRGHGATSLAVLAAIVTLFAIAATFLRRVPQRLSGRLGAVLAGTVSGALNVSSGVSGPPVAAYAAAQTWSAPQLVATAQAVFLPSNLAAFVVLDSAGFPPVLIFGGIAGTFTGVLVGTWLRGRLSPGPVRTGVLLAAAVGTLLVLARFA